MAADGHGRPEDLATRLAALAALLEHSGYSASLSNLMLFAFWDEALSPILGCRVDTAGFRRAGGLPFSDAVAAVTAGWAEAGRLSACKAYEGADCEALHPDEALFELGWALRDTPWARLFNGFVWAFHAEAGSGKPEVSRASESGDLRKMMMADPVFLADPWEEAGPAAVGLDLGRVLPALAGAGGNQAVGCMRAWMERVPEEACKRARTPGQAACLYARMLIGRAAKAFPPFGDARFLDNLRRLRFEEQVILGGDRAAVFVEFFDGAEAVASAAYVPATDVVWRESPKEGRPKWASREEAGALLSVEVAAAHRGKGYGTVALRHALSRGCRTAPPPPPGGEALWRAHGSPAPDGGWALVRVRWPVCGSLMPLPGAA
jgi:hypothetical protein